jgi:hypothetical protein
VSKSWASIYALTIRDSTSGSSWTITFAAMRTSIWLVGLRIRATQYVRISSRGLTGCPAIHIQATDRDGRPVEFTEKESG